jgi:hypothetical protein
MKRAWSGWAGSRRPKEELARGGEPALWKGLGSAPWREGTVLALCLAGSIGALWWLRPKTHRKGLPIAYANGLELLARHGLERAAAATARDFATAVHATYPAVGPAFEALTESYLGQRFGNLQSPGDADHLSALRQGLAHATRGLNRRGSIKNGREVSD